MQEAPAWRRAKHSRTRDGCASALAEDLISADAELRDAERGARVIGLAAFDSALNAPSGAWELNGHQLSDFRQLLGGRRNAERHREFLITKSADRPDFRL